MKILRSISIVLSVLVLLLSCQSSHHDDSDKLSQKEMDNLIAYTRGFLLNSKVKITEREKEIIKKQKPNIKDHYYGYKEGKVIFTWTFSEMRILNVNAEGDLLNPMECFWRILIVNHEREVNMKDEK